MAGLYIKNLDDELKAWLEARAKAEGFPTLSGYIKVHFNSMKLRAEQERSRFLSVETGRIENSSHVEQVDKIIHCSDHGACYLIAENGCPHLNNCKIKKQRDREKEKKQ